MKTCTKCKIEKDESEFNKNKVAKNGSVILFGCCKLCYNKQQQASYWANLEENRRKGREYQQEISRKPNSYYKRKREIVLGKAKVYRETNREKIKDGFKVFYKKNSHKIRARQKKKVENISEGYVRQLLMDKGFTKEQIEQHPQLIDVNKISLIIRRSKKLLNKTTKK